MKKFLSVFLIILFVFVSCGTKDDIWADATYKEDITFGNGEKTVVLEVAVLDNSVDFTIKTDAVTLGEALKEHSLIEGDEGEFGLYIKKVNGILADYNVNRAYWAFSKNGETMLSGVDTTEILNGDNYELTYTK